MRNILLFTILFLIVLSTSFSGIALINDTVIVEAGKNTTFCFFVFSRTGGNITIITPSSLYEIFDKIYLTNKSFVLKPYTEVCDNIDCVFNELCFKRVEEYCKLVCYIFYKEKTNEKYLKEYNSSVTILINNMFSESLGYSIILKNDGNNFDITETIITIVAIVIALILLLIFVKRKFL